MFRWPNGQRNVSTLRDTKARSLAAPGLAHVQEYASPNLHGNSARLGVSR